jgi:hypothetical protein
MMHSVQRSIFSSEIARTILRDALIEVRLRLEQLRVDATLLKHARRVMSIREREL